MPVETGTTLAQLDETWPLTGGAIPEGDDHIRLLKSVLKDQFPGSVGNGFNKAITASEDEINYLSGVTSGVQAQLDAQAGIDTDHENRITALEASNPADAAWPIGSVFFSASAANPNGQLGVGVWTRISEGRFIVGQGTGTDANSATRNYPAGNDVVGEYQHTLTESEMPGHSHSKTYQYVAGGALNLGFIYNDPEVYHGGGDSRSTANNKTMTTTTVGNDQPHENSPPAFGLYIWQRTA
jgi:hypothetical protein